MPAKSLRFPDCLNRLTQRRSLAAETNRKCCGFDGVPSLVVPCQARERIDDAFEGKRYSTSTVDRKTEKPFKYFVISVAVLRRDVLAAIE